MALDLPIAGVPLVECICWDKDRFGKDYLGEFDIAVEDIFANGQTVQEVTPTVLTFNGKTKAYNSQPKWYKLNSNRKAGKKKNEVSGEVQIQFSIYDPMNPAATPEELLSKFNSTVVSADDDDDLSRFASNEDVEAEVDEDTSDETDDPTKPETAEKRKRKRRLARLRRKTIAVRAYEFTGNSDVAGIIFAEVTKVTDLPPERNSKFLLPCCLTRGLKILSSDSHLLRHGPFRGHITGAQSFENQGCTTQSESCLQ